MHARDGSPGHVDLRLPQHRRWNAHRLGVHLTAAVLFGVVLAIAVRWFLGPGMTWTRVGGGAVLGAAIVTWVTWKWLGKPDGRTHFAQYATFVIAFVTTIMVTGGAS